MLIYKILTAAQMAAYQATGAVPLAPVDEADGYVHLSTAGQVAETARRHFSDHATIWLLTVEDRSLGEALRWEPSRGGALFPHYYGQLTAAHIPAVHTIRQGPDGFTFPPGIAP